MTEQEELRDALGVFRETFSEFEDFADAVWKAIGLPCLTDRQREIAHEMQYGQKRQFIACFRGIGKSYLGAAYALWRGFHDPTEVILILSGSPEKATEISDFMRQVIAHPHLPWLHFLQPRPGQKAAVGAWDFGASEHDTKQSASVTIASVGGAIQGKRATLVILDDCEQANNSDSETQRVKLLKRMMDTANMVIPDRNSKVVCLGTYQSLHSVYRRMTSERGYSAFVIPARVPTTLEEYEGELSPGVAALVRDPEQHGRPTDPKRFTDAHLKQQEQELGPLEWQIQMMLSTRVSDRLSHPLALGDLVVWDGVNPFGAPARVVPGRSAKEQLDDIPCYGLPGDCFHGPALVDQSDMLPYLTTIMAIDPAGNNGADETAYAVIGAVRGALYLLDSGGFVKGSDPKTMKALARIAKKFKVKQYIIESNLHAWATLFQQNAFDIHKAGVEERPSYQRKVDRIAGILDPVFSAGQLIVAQSVIEGEYQRAIKSGYGGGGDGNGAKRARERLLQWQIAMFRIDEKDGGLRHDDRLDALALGVGELAPTFLLSDAELQLAEIQEKKARDEDESWAEYMNSHDPFSVRRRGQREASAFAGRSGGRGRLRRGGTRLN